MNPQPGNARRHPPKILLCLPLFPPPPPQKKSVLIRSIRSIRVNSPPPKSLRALLLCGPESFGNANSFVRSAFRKFPRNPPLSQKKNSLKTPPLRPSRSLREPPFPTSHPYPSSPPSLPILSPSLSILLNRIPAPAVISRRFSPARAGTKCGTSIPCPARSSQTRSRRAIWRCV